MTQTRRLQNTGATGTTAGGTTAGATAPSAIGCNPSAVDIQFATSDSKNGCPLTTNNLGGLGPMRTTSTGAPPRPKSRHSMAVPQLALRLPRARLVAPGVSAPKVAQGEARPLRPQPPPRGRERAASKVAGFTAGVRVPSGARAAAELRYHAVGTLATGTKSTKIDLVVRNLTAYEGNWETGNGCTGMFGAVSLAIGTKTDLAFVVTVPLHYRYVTVTLPLQYRYIAWLPVPEPSA